MQAMRPSRLPVMMKKLYKRIYDEHGQLTPAENSHWIKSNCIDFKHYAQAYVPSLWAETEAVAAMIETQAAAILAPVPYPLGGGGIYPLLYFITRYRQPEYIVETGVAAGFSSYAFLEALRRNGKGVLYSSDFPYFRLPDPEQYIGIVVPPDLKSDWQLYHAGDEVNLPQIVQQIPRVDIFHYDSDKSYSGRRQAMQYIQPLLGAESLVFMDDIQDNAYFYDYVTAHPASNWRIFSFEGKYVGMVGDLQ